MNITRDLSIIHASRMVKLAPTLVWLTFGYRIFRKAQVAVWLTDFKDLWQVHGHLSRVIEELSHSSNLSPLKLQGHHSCSAAVNCAGNKR